MTAESVEDFLDTLTDEEKRADSFAMLELMTKLSGEKAKMWGPANVGFGYRELKYASGREVDTVDIGFSPRKQNFAVFITDGFDKYGELLGRLGKHSTGKYCLYFKRLADIDVKVLTEIIKASLKHVKSGR